MKLPLVGMKAVHGAGAAAMHELLVVVQVEAVEVGALAALDLLDAQDLALQQFDRLAGPRLEDEFRYDRACWSSRAPGGLGLFWLVGVFAQGEPDSAPRDPGATPRAMVRSISSSCCWFNRSLMTVSSIDVPSHSDTRRQSPVYRTALHERSSRSYFGFCRAFEAQTLSGMLPLFGRADQNCLILCTKCRTIVSAIADAFSSRRTWISDEQKIESRVDVACQALRQAIIE